MYAEVAFPLKVKSFTYKLQSDAPYDLIGRIVKAPLGNKTLYGIICSVSENPALFKAIDKTISIDTKSARIRQILSIHGYFGSSRTIDFLKWLSEYYISPIGVSLASCFFKDIVKIIEKFGLPDEAPPFSSSDLLNKSPHSDSEYRSIIDAIGISKYETFLLHSPSTSHQQAFLKYICEIASSKISGAIILVPEIIMIDNIANILQKVFSHRVCIIHSRIGNKKRLEVIKGILSGCFDIVVGTRSAILLPMKKISLIVVLNEHSISYKAEEGLRYNGRDVAVMRGFLEKTPVLLSSLCPSVESYNNAKAGKYHLLPFPKSLSDSLDSTFNSFAPRKRPNIEIINIRDAQNSGFSLSNKVLSDAKRLLHANESLLFIANKKGYSLIICRDCGYIFRCSKCNTAFIFHRTECLLRCSRCGQDRKAPDICNICSGVQLMPLGVGVERIKQELSESLDKEAILLQRNSEEINKNEPFTSFIIGHSHHALKLKNSIFKAAVFADIDIYFLESNYRVNEKLFQDIISVAELVKSDGHIYLQTRNPKEKILNLIKKYDFKGLYQNELSNRKEANLPPFSKIVLFKVFYKKDNKKIKESLDSILAQIQNKSVEILGPMEMQSPEKSQICLRFIIKSSDRKMLNNVASSLKEKLLAVKEIGLATDVDPISF